MQLENTLQTGQDEEEQPDLRDYDTALAFLRNNTHNLRDTFPGMKDAWFGMHFADVHLRTRNRAGVLYGPASEMIWKPNFSPSQLSSHRASVIVLDKGLPPGIGPGAGFDTFQQGVNWYYPVRTKQGTYWRTAHEGADVLPFGIDCTAALPSGLYLAGPDWMAKAQEAAAISQAEIPHHHVNAQARKDFREAYTSDFAELTDALTESATFRGYHFPHNRYTRVVSTRASDIERLPVKGSILAVPFKKAQLDYFLTLPSA